MYSIYKRVFKIYNSDNEKFYGSVIFGKQG